MKRLFYHLGHPSDEPHQIYAGPEGKRRFGRASWSGTAGGLHTGRLLVPYGEPRSDLVIVLPSPRIGDFVWTWYSDCIVTDGTLSLLTQVGFTGFEARPVIIERVKGVNQKHRGKVAVPPLWELLIQGKGGDAAPESGIYPLYEIEDSGVFRYSSFRNGIIVDKANWDGSDFFTINGYPKYTLVTEQVKELIISHHLTNCALIPAHKLEWGSDARPEDSLEKDRAMAARPLESLLADLESPDVSRHTIHVLGYKGDPRAVDPLIRQFDHPDPLIWHTAASSVAAIAKHKTVPEQIREEIFSKLSGLLGHANPLVRKSAATALGFIGGERAIEEVMRVFEDPDADVRDTGVFVMAYRRYKPALEAVRRLTRDRSKDVRETARMALTELSSEWP